MQEVLLTICTSKEDENDDKIKQCIENIKNNQIVVAETYTNQMNQYNAPQNAGNKHKNESLSI